jgi:hypothetical protein
LLADVVRRNGIEIGLGDFDEVAENRVVLDLEGTDPSPLNLLSLEIRDPLFALGRGRAQLIELRIEAVSENAAFFRRNGRLVHQGGRQSFHQFWKRTQPTS